MIEWWRSWHGAPLDPKWGVIARVAGVPRIHVVGLAWALLDVASKAPTRGDVSGADPEELAVALDIDPDQVRAVLAAMRAPNPSTGKPRFVGDDGRITEWERYQPPRDVPQGAAPKDPTAADRKRRQRDRDRDTTVTGRDMDRDTTVTGRDTTVTGRDVAPPAPPEDSRSSEPPLTPPAGGADDGAVDRVRTLVWRKSGLSDAAIQTKLASADSNGLRQVVRWLRLGLTEVRIVAAINRAFSEATDGIRRPWPYLDAVMTSEAERPAEADDCSAGGFVSTAVDWRKRLSDFVKCGFWMDGWGERPGHPLCEAPADLLAEFGFGG